MTSVLDRDRLNGVALLDVYLAFALGDLPSS